jgi:hypothetical protein
MAFEHTHVQYFTGADCDTDHYLLVAEISECMAVSKQAIQTFDVEIFNLRKLNDLKVRKQYQIKISNRFAALENLNDRENINRAWENMKENIKTSAKVTVGLYELKQHKPWFDECLLSLDQRKQDKMQWLQHPNQSSVGNLNNVRCKLVDISGNKRRNIWNLKFMNLRLRVR